MMMMNNNHNHLCSTQKQSTISIRKNPIYFSDNPILSYIIIYFVSSSSSLTKSNLNSHFSFFAMFSSFNSQILFISTKMIPSTMMMMMNEYTLILYFLFEYSTPQKPCCQSIKKNDLSPNFYEHVQPCNQFKPLLLTSFIYFQYQIIIFIFK